LRPRAVSPRTRTCRRTPAQSSGRSTSTKSLATSDSNAPTDRHDRASKHPHGRMRWWALARAVVTSPLPAAAPVSSADSSRTRVSFHRSDGHDGADRRRGGRRRVTAHTGSQQAWPT
jgi:hypothetical protein